MNLQKSKNATRNIAYGMVLKVYQMLMPFIMRTVLIYYLGADFLGLNSLFTSILQVLNLAELGVGSAMVFSMYKPIATNDTRKLCALLNLYRQYYSIIGFVVLAGGMVLVPFLPNLISGEIPVSVNLYVLYFLNLGATVLTYWMFSYKSSLLQAYQRADIVSKSFLITDTVKYVLQVVSLVFFRNYYGYCVSLLFCQILNNAFTAYWATKLYPKIKPVGNLPREEREGIKRKIKDLFTSKVATTLLSSGDTLVISSALGLVALATYQNYYYLISAVLGCFTIIHTAITAGVGNSLIVDAPEKVKDIFDTLLFAILWMVTFCVACFLCLMQPFIELWVGTEYMMKNILVILLSIYFCVYELVQFFSVYKEAAGIWHQDRFRPLICSVINIVLNLVLVRKFGVYGVVAATIVSSGFISLPWVIHNVCVYILKVSPVRYLKKFLPYLAAGGIVSLFLEVIVTKIHLPVVFDIGVKLVLCVIIVNGWWILLFRKRKEFHTLMALLRKGSPLTRRKT